MPSVGESGGLLDGVSETSVHGATKVYVERKERNSNRLANDICQVTAQAERVKLTWDWLVRV